VQVEADELGVDGDPSNVIGLSLPLLRQLLGEIDVQIYYGAFNKSIDTLPPLNRLLFPSTQEVI